MFSLVELSDTINILYLTDRKQTINYYLKTNENKIIDKNYNIL